MYDYDDDHVQNNEKDKYSPDESALRLSALVLGKVDISSEEETLEDTGKKDTGDVVPC